MSLEQERNYIAETLDRLQTCGIRTRLVWT